MRGHRSKYEHHFRPMLGSEPLTRIDSEVLGSELLSEIDPVAIGVGDVSDPMAPRHVLGRAEQFPAGRLDSRQQVVDVLHEHGHGDPAWWRLGSARTSYELCAHHGRYVPCCVYATTDGLARR